MADMIRRRTGWLIFAFVFLGLIAFPGLTDACGCMKCFQSDRVWTSWEYCRLENPGYTDCMEDAWGRCWYPSWANFCECITVTE